MKKIRDLKDEVAIVDVKLREFQSTDVESSDVPVGPLGPCRAVAAPVASAAASSAEAPATVAAVARSAATASVDPAEAEATPFEYAKRGLLRQRADRPWLEELPPKSAVPLRKKTWQPGLQEGSFARGRRPEPEPERLTLNDPSQLELGLLTVPTSAVLAHHPDDRILPDVAENPPPRPQGPTGNLHKTTRPEFSTQGLRILGSLAVEVKRSRVGAGAMGNGQGVRASLSG